MERQQLRERYEQLDWPQQIGNLASTMARIASRSVSADYDTLVSSLLREGALLIVIGQINWLKTSKIWTD